MTAAKSASYVPQLLLDDDEPDALDAASAAAASAASPTPPGEAHLRVQQSGAKKYVVRISNLDAAVTEQDVLVSWSLVPASSHKRRG